MPGEQVLEFERKDGQSVICASATIIQGHVLQKKYCMTVLMNNNL